MKKRTRKIVKKEIGITMIALVVTIIILLILASITIAIVTEENGIIHNANNAKEQAEIGEEKEIIDRATIQAMGSNSRGNLVEDELQEQLDKITEVGKNDVEYSGEEFNVVFKDSNRYYTVDKQGSIIEEGKIIVDKSPGDITKDEEGNRLKGDEDEPYEIWCIEDLVAFSKEVNEGHNYGNKDICLMQNLDFSSKLSYSDFETKEFDIYLGGDGNIGLKEQLSQNGKGFMPIGGLNNTQFWGNFNGNGKIIKNIYLNIINLDFFPIYSLQL